MNGTVGGMNATLDQLLGQLGEVMAEEFLVDHGASILERNYKSACGEADLLVLMDETVVAVEVKTRSVDDLVQPEESVTWWQLKRIVHALATYAMEAEMLEMPWRVDLIAIETDSDGTVIRLDHIPNIFPP
jgi:putative endonuclease